MFPLLLHNENDYQSYLNFMFRSIELEVSGKKVTPLNYDSMRLLFTDPDQCMIAVFIIVFKESFIVYVSLVITDLFYYTIIVPRNESKIVYYLIIPGIITSSIINYSYFLGEHGFKDINNIREIFAAITLSDIILIHKYIIIL